jgi:GNAT superfamily N-acetyltransferase
LAPAACAAGAFFSQAGQLLRIPVCTHPLVLRIGDAPELEAFLAQRIHEFNAQAIGCFDGECFSATQRSDGGAIQGGISGYTWGGCCYVTNLWVEASERAKGLGRKLVCAAEEHALRVGCTVVFVDTHTFQAPGFYLRMGYRELAVIDDHPVGHANLVLEKRLLPNEG